MAETTQEPGKQQSSFERISAEFSAWKTSLPETDQADPNLWGKFLLKREDDGGEMFARTVDDSIDGMQKGIVSLVEAGSLDEAAILGTLTKALKERYSKMYSPIEGQSGTRFERVIAPAGQ